MAAGQAVPVAEREMFIRAARGVTAAAKLPITDSPVIGPQPSNLPAPMTSMVNRAPDQAAVTALLLRDDVRLVTVAGPPGMRKTRLSVRAAEQVLTRFADGARFVDLSAITDPDLVLSTVAVTLGLAPVPSLSPVQRVQTALRDKELLLVLDNLEQVVDGAALDVAALLQACPGVKVLATSRVRILDAATTDTLVLLLGLGVFCLGLAALSNIDEDELDKL